MAERFSPELFRKVGQVRALFRAMVGKFPAETHGSEEPVRVMAGDERSFNSGKPEGCQHRRKLVPSHLNGRGPRRITKNGILRVSPGPVCDVSGRELSMSPERSGWPERFRQTGI